MSSVIQVDALQKSFGGKTAIQNLSFSVSAGRCFGLLGPNGAGKSTTMKILAGIIQADQGKVELWGQKITDKKQRKIWDKVGYVPQSITLYEKLSAYENLHFFAKLYNIEPKKRKERIESILAHTGLKDRAKDAIETFSGGMKRRINIGVALLHEPQLLILDEPTVGIDPQSRNHIFDMIHDLKKQGVTVIYSTHYMEEVEALCDEVMIMDQGKRLAAGSLDELLQTHAAVSIYFEADAVTTPLDIASIQQMKRQGEGWRIETDHVLVVSKEIIRLAEKNNWDIKRLEIAQPPLEEVFFALTGTALRDN